MGLLKQLFAPKPKQVQRAGQRNHVQIEESRGQLLSMAVHDTLSRTGIPTTWITAEVSPAVTAHKERGMHLRLVLRQWQPTLMEHGVALQKLIRLRISRLDPFSAQWLAGITWKLDVSDDTNCPTLPGPVHWKSIMARTATGPAERSTSQSERAALEKMIDAGDAKRPHPGELEGWAPTQPSADY